MKRKGKVVAGGIAAAALIGGLLIVIPPAPSPLPVLSIARAGNNVTLNWQTKPGIRYEVEANDAVIGVTSNGQFTVPIAPEMKWFRLRLTQPGELELPGGEGLSCRQIARRTSDGLNAYCYPGAGVMRVALFQDIGDAVTFDVPSYLFGMGVACAFAGDSLMIVGSNPDYATVLDFSISGDWPPVITENSAWVSDYDPTYSLRWPWAAGLTSGGFVATWYQQRQDGLHALVAYRSPAGNWTAAEVDVMGYSVSTQTAGNALVVQHPEDGSVWVCGVKDSWGVLTVARLDEKIVENDFQLVFRDNVMIADGWPHDGVVDPCAFDSELPINFRVVPENAVLRVLGNAYGFMVVIPSPYLKVDRLVSYTVTANVTKSTPTLSSNWTERVQPDYAWADGRVFMFPVATNAAQWPSTYDAPLVLDRSGTVAVNQRWLPIAAGARALAYRKPDGKVVVNRL